MTASQINRVTPIATGPAMQHKTKPAKDPIVDNFSDLRRNRKIIVMSRHDH